MAEHLADETREETTHEDNEPSVEENDSSDEDNGSSEEELILSWNRIMAPATKTKTTPKKAAPAAAAAAAIKKKPAPPAMGVFARLAPPEENEITFIPKASEGQYSADRHDRYWIQMEMDSSFTGAAGSYSLAIDNDGTQFVFKIPVDEVFSDPHDSHALLENKFKRCFGSDSAKAANWKLSNGHMHEKFWAFRILLPFTCEKNFADDLGHPGVVLAKLTPTVSKKSVTVLHIEMKSICQLEKPATVAQNKSLAIESFVSPSKAVGANGDGAQQAKLLELLFQMGLTLPDIKKKCKDSGFGEMMDIDDAYAKYNSKRSRQGT